MTTEYPCDPVVPTEETHIRIRIKSTVGDLTCGASLIRQLDRKTPPALHFGPASETTPVSSRSCSLFLPHVRSPRTKRRHRAGSYGPLHLVTCRFLFSVDSVSISSKKAVGNSPLIDCARSGMQAPYTTCFAYCRDRYLGLQSKSWSLT